MNGPRHTTDIHPATGAEAAPFRLAVGDVVASNHEEMMRAGRVPSVMPATSAALDPVGALVANEPSTALVGAFAREPGNEDCHQGFRLEASTQEFLERLLAVDSFDDLSEEKFQELKDGGLVMGEVVFQHWFEFPDGMSVCGAVHAGESNAWVDFALYNKDGFEVSLTEPSRSLLEECELEHDGMTYSVGFQAGMEIPEVKPLECAKEAREQPPLCFVYIPGNTLENSVGIVKRGESGYYPAKVNPEALPDTSSEFVRAFVHSLNADLGVDPEEAERMMIGSMFGWDAPGANRQATA